MALTSAQIVTLACQEAKVPGFTSQAGQFLNAILSDLCQQYDFDKARKVITITLLVDVSPGSVNGAGPYVLPADYLRAKLNDIFYAINGVTYFPIPLDQADYDALVQTPGLQSYPTFVASDMSQTPPVMWFWQPPSGAYVVTVRYFCQMPNITGPETSTEVPWFPHQTYLTTKVASELMKISGDSRQSDFEARAEAYLIKYMKMQDDNSDRAQNVKLDRRRFAGYGANLKNTKVIGWAVVISLSVGKILPLIIGSGLAV